MIDKTTARVALAMIDSPNLHDNDEIGFFVAVLADDPGFGHPWNTAHGFGR